MRWARRLAWVVAIAWLTAASARAQAPVPAPPEPVPDPSQAEDRPPRQAPGPARVEFSVLGGLVGGGELGDGSATVLTNQVPTSGETSLFTTRAHIDAAAAVEGRIGLRLTRRFWLEGGVNYARPDFAVEIAADIEGAPDVTATSMLTQVLIDASLQYRWPGRRFTPFLLGGAGYLRQLDDTRATAETGWLAQGGGGVVVRLAPASKGFAGRLALRGDVRIVWLRDGVVLDRQRGATYTAVAGLSLGL